MEHAPTVPTGAAQLLAIQFCQLQPLVGALEINLFYFILLYFTTQITYCELASALVCTYAVSLGSGCKGKREPFLGRQICVTHLYSLFLMANNIVKTGNDVHTTKSRT
jgi:hypothetical protein